jgi:hypothetical protein
MSTPPALAELRDFRGTIQYVARRDGALGTQDVVGSLVIDNGRFSFNERSARYALHADLNGASAVVDGEPAAVGDIFEAEPLANAWAAAAGLIATERFSPARGTSVWISSAGMRLYLDPTGARLEGMNDGSGRNHLGFVFADWSQFGPIAAPQRILSLRDGVPNAAFSISHYVVDPASRAGTSGRAPFQEIARLSQSLGGTTRIAPWETSSAQPVALQLGLLGAMLLLSAFAVAWTRRDALLLALCRTLARDPRGWRRAGVSIFVGPDGALTFDGIRYRVGPHFFNRVALVQVSVLFLRVSAPGVPRIVILPRRFRPIDLGIRIKRTSAGLTLIETIVATAFFTSLIMLAIYPALLALSSADQRAQRRDEASSIALDALSDQQAASAYGVQPATGTTMTTIDGLSLTVTLTPAGLHNVDDLDIMVADASGNALAHVVGMIGPPVAPPPHSGGGPPRS